MNAIKNARKFIASQPDHPDAAVLSALVLALESDQSFVLADLYGMSLDHFELAVAVIRQWRLDRYYVGKARLLDISLHWREVAGSAQAS